MRSLGPVGASALEPLRGGTLVITGGSGFVGVWLSTLCAYLNDKHNFGIALVLTARRKARLDDSAPHLAGRRDIHFVAADIRQFIDIPASASWIIHATGSPDNRAMSSNPMETMDVISAGTYRVLRTAEQCLNFRMLVNLSSGRHLWQPAGRDERLARGFHRPGRSGDDAVSLCRGQALWRGALRQRPQPVAHPGGNRAALHLHRPLPGAGCALGDQQFPARGAAPAAAQDPGRRQYQAQFPVWQRRCCSAAAHAGERHQWQHLQCRPFRTPSP